MLNDSVNRVELSDEGVNTGVPYSAYAPFAVTVNEKISSGANRAGLCPRALKCTLQTSV